MHQVSKAQISDQFQYRQSVLRDCRIHPMQLASPSLGSIANRDESNASNSFSVTCWCFLTIPWLKGGTPQALSVKKKKITVNIFSMRSLSFTKNVQKSVSFRAEEIKQEWQNLGAENKDIIFQPKVSTRVGDFYCYEDFCVCILLVTFFSLLRLHVFNINRNHQR